VDTLLSPIMDDLRACATSALETSLGGSVVCATTLMPGTLAPADWCSCKGRSTCGMLWVRLVRLYPAGERFPSQDASTRASCASVLAAVLEVGVYRCQPTSGPQGTPPPVHEQTQAALVQADDALSLIRGINCCDAVVKRPHVLGNYTPRDGGGCGGGAWEVTVQLLPR
jgi:hypothetical protein